MLTAFHLGPDIEQLQGAWDSGRKKQMKMNSSEDAGGNEEGDTPQPTFVAFGGLSEAGAQRMLEDEGGPEHYQFMRGFLGDDF